MVCYAVTYILESILTGFKNPLQIIVLFQNTVKITEFDKL